MDGLHANTNFQFLSLYAWLIKKMFKLIFIEHSINKLISLLLI